MYKEIKEGKAKILVPKEEKISKELPVFYNSVMKFNRDVSIALLKVLNENLVVALPLAGTGIRGIRMLLELDNIEKVDFNDLSKDACDLIGDNLRLNFNNFKDNRDENKLNKINIRNTKNNLKINEEINLNNINNKIKIYNSDANLFLLESKGYNYIDIDPFGSPNFLLDSACKRISRNGILAVTATDTSALAGTFPKACLRKYWAKPLKNHLMHEIGLRILIRKCQLIGAQYEKALIPILSYSKDHYMRIFFRIKKGKQKVDELIKKHKYIKINFNEFKISTNNDGIHAGLLWTGKLYDKKIIEKIKLENKFMDIIKNELDIPFFYDLHYIARELKRMNMVKKDELIKRLKENNIKVSETHFAPTAIKTEINYKELKKIIQSFFLHQ